MGIALLTDPVDLGKALINRGGVHHTTGARVHGPRRTSTLPWSCWVTGHNIEAAMAEHNLGCADLLRGDLVSALAHMDRRSTGPAPARSRRCRDLQPGSGRGADGGGAERSGFAVLDETARTFGHHHLPQRRGEAELDDRARFVRVRPATGVRRGARGTVAVLPDPVVARPRRGVGPRGRGPVRAGSGRRSSPRATRLRRSLTRLSMPWWAIDSRLDAALVAIRRGEVEEAGRRLARIRVSTRAPLAVRSRDRILNIVLPQWRTWAKSSNTSTACWTSTASTTTARTAYKCREPTRLPSWRRVCQRIASCSNKRPGWGRSWWSRTTACSGTSTRARCRPP